MTATVFVPCIVIGHLGPIMPPSTLPKLDPYSRHARDSRKHRPKALDSPRGHHRTGAVAHAAETRLRYLKTLPDVTISDTEIFVYEYWIRKIADAQLQ